MTKSTLPVGNHARLMYCYHAGTPDKAGNPFAGKTFECVDRMVVSSAGKTVAGSSLCFTQDATGIGACTINCTT